VSGSPLAGLRVVAFEQAVAIPYCSFVLAELGADVIKIERPGTGDGIRYWDGAVRGLSTGYVWLNAGKRDLAVDVGSESGRDIVRRLADGADVFLENFAPGVAERLGLGAAELRRSNPRLVYCSLSGYGQTGPYRDVKAYDLLIQGEAGIIATTGTVAEPAKVGIPVADLIGGTTATIGILAAVRERDRTGEGAYLDVSLFDSALSWLGYFPHFLWHTGGVPARSGVRHQAIVPYGPYRARDGREVNIVITSDDQWRRFCSRVVERPDWLTDERFATIAARFRNRVVVERAVEEELARLDASEWFARLGEAGLPYGEVRDIAGVVSHPQTAARGMVVEASSEVGELPLVRFPLAAGKRARRIPAIGEHTREVLAELGLSDGEIERLRADGVVAWP
jgi:crotonobetainyl-CoA:carnitine CoA-transferase CaiB-like acyl-CoA transferase